MILGQTVTPGDDILADGRLLLEFDGETVQSAVNHGLADIHKIGLQQGEDIHGLGIAEAGIVFQQPDALLRDHETAVHDPFVIISCFPIDRLGNFLRDRQSFRYILRMKKGKAVIFTGIGAHTPRIRALVIGEAPLVILNRRGSDHRPAVAQALQRELFALQFFLDGDTNMFP